MNNVEEKIQSGIVALLESINGIIPIKWEELYVNISMSNEGGSVYFDFRPTNSSEFHYSLMLPTQFSVDDSDFKISRYNQFDLGYEIWKVFVDNNLPIWSSMIIHYIDKKLSTTFDYSPWLESEFSPTDLRDFYKFRYLGVEPKNNAEKELLEKMQIFHNQYND